MKCKLAALNTSASKQALERVWRGGPHTLLVGVQKRVQPLWKTVWRRLKKLKIELP